MNKINKFIDITSLSIQEEILGYNVVLNHIKDYINCKKMSHQDLLFQMAFLNELQSKKIQTDRSIIKTLFYNIGRMLSYGTIGLLIGLVGEGIKLSGFMKWLSISSGLILIAYSIFPYFTTRKRQIGWCCSKSNRNHFQDRYKRVHILYYHLEQPH